MNERVKSKNITPVVAGEKIYKSYPSGDGKLDVLLGLDISIYKGEVVTLVGPSGSGKSTLLHILGALDKPTKGRVLLGGEDVWRLSDGERSNIRNRRVGFVFQFHHLLPEFTALENIMMSLLIYGIGKKVAEKKAQEMLSLLGLAGRAEHYPSQLSGGEAQRVAVGRAVVGSPDIVLADEPSGNLDTGSKNMLHELILQFNRELSTTFLIATHNEQLAGLGARTLHLSDGAVVREVHNSYAL